MARTAALIQAEIDALEADITSLVQSGASDSTSASKIDYRAKTARLDFLYLALDRITGAAPMFARGRLTGLGEING